MQISGGRRCTELSIDYAKLGIVRGESKPVGLAVYDAWTGYGPTVDYRWPGTAVWNNPSTWNNVYSRDAWDYPADSTPPHSGTCAPGSTYTRSTTLSSSWSFEETETWITGYRYAVGHSATTTNVVDWTNTNATSISLPGMHSGPYFIRVQARNPWGMWSQPATSGCVMIDTLRPNTYAPRSASVRRGSYARFYYKINDAYSPRAQMWVYVKNLRGRVIARWYFGSRRTNFASAVAKRALIARGRYRFLVLARDLSGNSQYRTGWNYLTVR